MKKQEIAEARESKITYQELFDASEIFGENPEARSEYWIKARRFVDWKNLHNLPTVEIIERVIKLLNNWGCYLYTEEKNYPKMAERIKEAYRKSIPFLKALENETLEDLDFEKKTDIDGKEYANEEILQKVFADFCQVGYKFKGVAASKVLSLINPHLFVMWDITICVKYGIRSPSDPNVRDKQYVPDFISVMKKKANDVIDSYMKDKKCTREEAVKAINNFREWRPLAKLLDEYNWKKYVLDMRN
jgi:hypothetical protein